MSQSNCNLVLENYKNAFLPGQIIVGKFECFFHSEKRVRGIYVQLTGKASVKWEEKVHNDIITYSAEEEYFNVRLELVATKKDGTVIPSGVYKYPFQYVLPNNLPSSIEADNYNIRYDVLGVVDRPWKFDYVTKEKYNVTSPMDLNTTPDVQIPLTFSEKKITRTCCIKTGFVKVDVSLPRTGFVPGDEILAKIAVSNKSPLTIEVIKIKLIKEIEYTAYKPYQKTLQNTDILFKMESSPVSSHADKNYDAILKLPKDIIIPNLNNCAIIKFIPKIWIKIILSWHGNMNIKIPILVGQVPLNQSTNL